MRHVVVTGASSGIGRATVEELAARGFHVFGSVRSEQDAEALRAIGGRISPLLFDVTDVPAIGRAAATVAEAVGDGGLAGLVNNAGIAVTGPLQHLPIEDLQRQLDVNLLGVLRVTQAFLPLLGARRDCPFTPGRIVNISSVSGRFAMPFLGPYAASKFALEALSDSLRRELMLYGIDVIVIEPGRIRTPIWEKGDDVGPYAASEYGLILKRLEDGLQERLATALPAATVAAVIHRALTAPRPRTRYAIPDQRFAGWILPRLLPDRWLDRLIFRMLMKG